MIFFTFRDAACRDTSLVRFLGVKQSEYSETCAPGLNLNVPQSKSGLALHTASESGTVFAGAAGPSMPPLLITVSAAHASIRLTTVRLYSTGFAHLHCIISIDY